MSFFSRKIRLPITQLEFDELCAKVVKKFKLVDPHHAAAIMSHAIRHIPNEEAYTTMDYLGQYILKNIANYVAHTKSEGLKHEAEVRAVENELKQNPGNMQARDALEKACLEGSPLAKQAYERLYPGQNLVDIKPKLTVVPEAPPVAETTVPEDAKTGDCM